MIASSFTVDSQFAPKDFCVVCSSVFVLVSYSDQVFINLVAFLQSFSTAINCLQEGFPLLVREFSFASTFSRHDSACPLISTRPCGALFLSGGD